MLKTKIALLKSYTVNAVIAFAASTGEISESMDGIKNIINSKNNR